MRSFRGAIRAIDRLLNFLSIISYFPSSTQALRVIFSIRLPDTRPLY